MPLRLVFSEGYTNFGLGALHPNGDVYLAVGMKVGTKFGISVRRRSVGGAYTEVRRYVQDKDFQGAVGVCQAIPMPDGSLLVSFPATYGGSVSLYEDVIPNACPKFTVNTMYSYSVSAEDRVARQASEAAVQAAQRAEQAAVQAKAQVKADGAKVEARINEVVDAAKKAVAAIRPSATAITDAIEAQLNNSSRLAAFIWSKARDASWLHLKETGLIK